MKSIPFMRSAAGFFRIYPERTEYNAFFSLYPIPVLAHFGRALFTAPLQTKRVMTEIIPSLLLVAGNLYLHHDL